MDIQTPSHAELNTVARPVSRVNPRRQRIPDQVALCGSNFYNSSPHTRALGNFWRHCRHCGRPIHYYDTYAEAQANNRECGGP